MVFLRWSTAVALRWWLIDTRIILKIRVSINVYSWKKRWRGQLGALPAKMGGEKGDAGLERGMQRHPAGNSGRLLDLLLNFDCNWALRAAFPLLLVFCTTLFFGGFLFLSHVTSAWKNPAPDGRNICGVESPLCREKITMKIWYACKS